MKKVKDTEPVRYAVIGGSGVYEIEGIRDVREVRVKTPFGNPSDAIVVGRLGGILCAFLPRHARGHRILPTELPSKANIYALKSLGVEQIIAIGACGSLKEELAPRHFVFPDQLFDRTRLRSGTFFGDGIVGHVSFDHPYCSALSSVLADTAQELGITVHRGGTYVCIEGPSFSTKAESEVNRKLGFSVVGMTALPEAKLAREAEICYSTVALVTDYDVWKEGEEVTVEKVVETLNANVDNVKRLIRQALPRLERKRTCACSSALRYAIFTNPKAMNPKIRKKLDLLIGRYVNHGQQ
ncbi:MAG TPA: S-methyl-5'-thioadenosine phosphorylase [Elusimicrobiota bacterium]|nr:S-methyl-5'-thioadenosine phosphorylase [Elusimicrobiota bacterium]